MADSFEHITALREQPDDEGPRLALANARSMQCALVRHPDDVEVRDMLLARTSALLDEHEEAWLEPLGLKPHEVEGSRDFVETVTLPSKARTSALVNAPSMARLTRLPIPSADGAPHPPWSCSRRRGWRKVSLDAQGIRALLANPHLHRLTELDLGFNPSETRAPRPWRRRATSPDATPWGCERPACVKPG